MEMCVCVSLSLSLSLCHEEGHGVLSGCLYTAPPPANPLRHHKMNPITFRRWAGGRLCDELWPSQ